MINYGYIDQSFWSAAKHSPRVIGEYNYYSTKILQ